MNKQTKIALEELLDLARKSTVGTGAPPEYERSCFVKLAVSHGLAADEGDARRLYKFLTNQRPPLKDAADVQTRFRSLRYAVSVDTTLSDRDRDVLLALIDVVILTGRTEVGFHLRDSVSHNGGLMPRMTVARALESLAKLRRIEVRGKNPNLVANQKWVKRMGVRAPNYYKVSDQYATSAATPITADIESIREAHGQMLDVYHELRASGVGHDEAMEAVNAAASELSYPPIPSYPALSIVR